MGRAGGAWTSPEGSSPHPHPWGAALTPCSVWEPQGVCAPPSSMRGNMGSRAGGWERSLHVCAPPGVSITASSAMPGLPAPKPTPMGKGKPPAVPFPTIPLLPSGALGKEAER